MSELQRYTQTEFGFRKCRKEVKWFTGAVRGACRLLDWPGSDSTGGRPHRRHRSFPGCRTGRSGTAWRARGRGGQGCVKARTERSLLHPAPPRHLLREGDGGLPCPLRYQALRDHRVHPGGRKALREGSNLARRDPKIPTCNCTMGTGKNREKRTTLRIRDRNESIDKFVKRQAWKIQQIGGRDCTDVMSNCFHKLVENTKSSSLMYHEYETEFKYCRNKTRPMISKKLRSFVWNERVSKLFKIGSNNSMGRYSVPVPPSLLNRWPSA